MGIAHQPAADGNGRRYARFGLVIGRPAAVRVDQVLGAVRSTGTAEQRTPEPHHIPPRERVDGDLDGLNGGRVRRDP
ncbi:hypothetical protein GCM10010300_47670 [Streptomyces olivaceoviridis]|nr:hypothetical protein GCM10010300_47670 [Streptomyces olivaceoviridis]